MTATSDLYAELVEHLQRTATLSSCSAVLSWDEQTYMPPRGAEHRASQLAMLAGLTHEQSTSPRIGELLDELQSRDDMGPADSDPQTVVREARRSYDRQTKLPRKLVEEMSRTTTLGQQAWIEARRNCEFARFEPWLEKILGLKREEAAAIGYGDGQPYDALLDDYEPGATSAEVTAAFQQLRAELVPLVSAIRESSHKPDVSVLTRTYPVEAQRNFGQMAAAAIGFDFEAGRLDVTAHPFCSGFGPGDCRITTRYDEHHFPGAFFGTLHEAGHGMYEQGLDASSFGTAPGTFTSLGIHESQSRMWENLVGRSLAFWQHFYGAAQAGFPGALSDVPLATFHEAINDVRPSYIRVESDEVTYNLHIMLRFELEQAMLSGDLQAADVPAAWDEAFHRDFGLKVENVAQGCLQDIHWSAGLLGYFPTYALGNMYAAQFFKAAEAELGDLHEMFAKGEFRPLLDWLRRNIHHQGRRWSAPDLVCRVTGQPLSHKPLMDHLHHRFDRLYGLQ